MPAREEGDVLITDLTDAVPQGSDDPSAADDPRDIIDVIEEGDALMTDLPNAVPQGKNDPSAAEDPLDIIDVIEEGDVPINDLPNAVPQGNDDPSAADDPLDIIDVIEAELSAQHPAAHDVKAQAPGDPPPPPPSKGMDLQPLKDILVLLDQSRARLADAIARGDAEEAQGALAFSKPQEKPQEAPKTKELGASETPVDVRPLVSAKETKAQDSSQQQPSSNGSKEQHACKTQDGAYLLTSNFADDCEMSTSRSSTAAVLTSVVPAVPKTGQPPEPPEASSRRTTKQNSVSSTFRRMTQHAADQVNNWRPARTKHQAERGLFFDPEEMKAKIRQTVLKPKYSVTRYYKDKGLAQSFARSAIFSDLCMAMVVLNLIWMAYEVDNNDEAVLSNASPLIRAGEHFFCAFFFWEWLVRFFAFAKKRNCFMDSWFKFDTAITLLTVMETWVFGIILLVTGVAASEFMDAGMLRLVRMIRLSKLGRMARLFRQLPELLILIKGITVAIRSMLFTMILLNVIIFFFAVFFRQLSKGTPLGEKGGFFHSVPMSINTLLIAGAFPDLRDILDLCLEEGIFFWFTMVVFALLSSLTVLNMLIGVLVEVVGAVSRAERERMDMKVAYSIVQDFVEDVARGCQQQIADDDEEKDFDQSELRVTKHAFNNLLHDDAACRALNSLNVNVVGLCDWIDIWFYNDEPVKMTALVEKIMQLRGGNEATVKDIVDLRQFMSIELATLRDRISGTCSATERKQSVRNSLKKHV